MIGRLPTSPARAKVSTARKQTVEGSMTMRTTILGSLAGLGIVALLALSPAAFAETQNYKAALTAASAVPPNDSKGSGSLTATYSGLTGPAAAAHFHGPADAKTNAPIVVPVSGPMASPMKGEATLTDAQAADLQAGKWYFNIHTAAHKGGEIRGQVMKGM